ncbi:MAG: hypothetical protein EPN14_09795 [Gallionella sp.]|nr:MAG: hypothetical protein EPN14_09795 [Gallionella sp.]
MLLPVLFAIVSSIVLVSAGGVFYKKEKWKAGLLLILGEVLIFLSIYSVRAPFSLLRDGEMRNAAYVVDFKLDDADGKTIILFVSDAKTGGGRVAALSKYPPDGYREVQSRDRLPLLLNESLIRSPPPNK